MNEPFAACCVLDLVQQCELRDYVLVKGEVIEDPDGCDFTTCPGTSETWNLMQGAITCGGNPWEPTGFDDTKPYFRGQFPFGGDAAAYEVIMFCDSTSLRWAIPDVNNCAVMEGNVIWDCNSLSGYFDVNIESFFAAPDCCPGGPGVNIQTFRVKINGGGP